MEIFDVKKFNQNNVNGHYDYVDNGIEVRQWVSAPEYYVERTRKINSPYETYKEFHYKNGLLKQKGELFYNFSIGVWKEYDESEHLISETNYDSSYKFSIEDLNKLMKRMNVNIMDMKSGVTVQRASSGKPLYFVNYPINPTNHYKIFKLTIDGNTGKVLEKIQGQIKE